MKKCFLTDQSLRHLKVHRDCYINAFLMWFYAVPRMTPAYLQIYFSVIGDIRQLVYEMNWFQYLWYRWYSWFRVGIENLRGSWRGSQGHRVYVPPPFRKKIKELKSSSLNLPPGSYLCSVVCAAEITYVYCCNRKLRLKACAVNIQVTIILSKLHHNLSSPRLTHL